MVHVRCLEPDDVAALDRLFRSRFGHGLSREEWEWKYRRGPGETRSVGAFADDGRLLAHAGVTGRPARWSGGDGLLWQGVDFVAAEGGSGLRPPILRAGRAALGGTPGAADVPWNYGFPSARHEGLGERVFGYLQAGEVEVWEGPVRPGAPAAIEAGEVAASWAEEAWERCGGLGTVRSPDYLNWRYHARPERYYRVYRLDGGSAQGLAVAAFLGATAALAELWLPPSGRWGASLAGLSADLAASGIERLRVWRVPGGPATAEALELLGTSPTSERLILASRGARGEDRRGQAAALPYTMGDYDAV